jgi:hypothetical protein
MSGHCHNEHAGHGHDGHDRSGGGHDHSDDLTPATQSYLYSEIEFDNIITMNETMPSSGRAITEKTWQHRMDVMPELQSNADEQLLMHIPYESCLSWYSIER